MDNTIYNYMDFEAQLNRKDEVIVRQRMQMETTVKMFIEEMGRLMKERDDQMLEQTENLLTKNLRLLLKNIELEVECEGARQELLLSKCHTVLFMNNTQKFDTSEREAQLEAEIERLKKENQELKAQQEVAPQGEDEEVADVEQSLIGQIENKPILSLVWRLMQLDGAKKRKRGDVKIINQILEMITGFPYDSCKKVWEVGNRPITRKAEDIDMLNKYMKAIGMKIQL